ncbi:4610_t:CDS:2, partial [Gigaspora rosea]
KTGGKKQINIKGIKEFSKNLRNGDGSFVYVTSEVSSENTILIYQKTMIERDVIPIDKNKNIIRKPITKPRIIHVQKLLQQSVQHLAQQRPIGESSHESQLQSLHS